MTDTINQIDESSCEKKIALFISHSDIYSSHAGTEKFQIEEIKRLNMDGVDVLHAYPSDRRRYAIFFKKMYYGVNFNGHALYKKLSWNQLNHIVEEYCSPKGFCFIALHHLYRWKHKNVQCLLDKFAGCSINFYVHDMHFSCPSHFYLFNDKEYCGAIENDLISERCRSCKHGRTLARHRKDIAAIMDRSSKIVYPSKVVEKVLLKYNSEQMSMDKRCFQEHLIFVDEGEKKATLLGRRKIRIAYLGTAHRNKGFDVFISLVKSELLQKYYEFVHIGSGPRHANVEQVSYSYLDSGRHAARNALLVNNIDLVILWSIVPESYSYTLHEAYAAAVPILTYKDSGNIAYKINSGDIYGKSFLDSMSLYMFLKDEAAVRNFILAQCDKRVLGMKHNYCCK